ncbi:aspartate kinase [Candidatus Woesearchaeota archaeon]|nr:aspartate kinase [Candidatus Woesearchaeota archaeon]
MIEDIVSKFGGSSLANARQIDAVREIVESDPRRRFVVLSAPGTDDEHKTKVTDSLLNIATDGEHFRKKGKSISAKESHDYVVNRFGRIITDLGIEGNDLMENLRRDLQNPIEGKKRADFFASRGEHYHAQIIARYFKKRGLSAIVRLPEDVGLFVSNNFGNAKVLPISYSNLEKLKLEQGIVVFPGFYGITEDKDVAVFSRGGSDLTGGELAFAINTSLYENWTDTDGIYQADPRLITDAKVIPRLTYKEIRILAAKGFNVFHYGAMLNCKNRNIPINVRNTNNPSAPGTMIVSERVPEETVVGIARLDDVASVYIEKDMMDEEIGFTHDLLKIFKEYEVSTHHYPTDIDDIAVLVAQKDLVGKANDVRAAIERRMNPDRIEMTYNLSIVSPVGIGMKGHPEVEAIATTALAKRSIVPIVSTKSPAQISHIFAVEGYNADNALHALYDAFLM